MDIQVQVELNIVDLRDDDDLDAPYAAEFLEIRTASSSATTVLHSRASPRQLGAQPDVLVREGGDGSSTHTARSASSGRKKRTMQHRKTMDAGTKGRRGRMGDLHHEASDRSITSGVTAQSQHSARSRQSLLRGRHRHTLSQGTESLTLVEEAGDEHSSAHSGSPDGRLHHRQPKGGRRHTLSQGTESLTLQAHVEEAGDEQSSAHSGSPDRDGKEPDALLKDVRSCTQNSGQHVFNAFQTPRAATCSKCHRRVEKCTLLFGCESCDVNLCTACNAGPCAVREEMQASTGEAPVLALLRAEAPAQSSLAPQKKMPTVEVTVMKMPTMEVTVTTVRSPRSGHQQAPTVAFAPPKRPALRGDGGSGSSPSEEDEHEHPKPQGPSRTAPATPSSSMITLRHDLLASEEGSIMTVKVSIGAARSCMLCHRAFKGFGDQCASCRKNPNGTSQHCSNCGQYFTGYIDLCSECQ